MNSCHNHFQLSLDNLSQWRAEQNAKYEAVRHEREELVKKFWEWRERHNEFISMYSTQNQWLILTCIFRSSLRVD